MIDRKYRSSSRELDYFMSSHVWEDWEEELQEWLEGVRDDMERADSMEELARSQGRADVLRRVLAWPNVTQELIASEGG